MRRRSIVLAACVAVAQPAQALTFDFTVIPGDTLTAEQAGAFTAAANAWSAVLRDPFTVSVQIGFRALGGSILGQTAPVLLQGPAAFVDTLLAADAKTADDAAAVASLPAAPTGTLLVTKAQAKALGVAQTGSDGTIEFSTGFTFSTERNPDNTIAAGTFDLIGVAIHEIGHMLGFESGLDYAASRTILDQFRYASAGVRSFSAGAYAYFSIDGGTTSQAAFSVGGPGNSQASHWIANTGGVFDPTYYPGQVRDLTALDVRAMDVIGYDATVPEPASAAVLLAAVAGVLTARRRQAAR